MKIEVYGNIVDKAVVGNDFTLIGLYDPNNLLNTDKYGVEVTIKLKISKKGNLVAIVDKITTI